MAACGFDVAYVYREAALGWSAWLERLLAERRPVVFDFDDAIYLPTASDANAWTGLLTDPRKADGSAAGHDTSR